MEKLLQQLIVNTNRLAKLRDQKIEVKTSVFYKIFGTESDREMESIKINEAIKNTLDMRHMILENIELQINKEKYRISNDFHSINLEKIQHELNRA